MRLRFPAAVVLLIGVAACDEALPSANDAPHEEPQLTAAMAPTGAGMLDAINNSLESQGAAYRVSSAQYYTDPSSNRMGSVIFARDVGNKRIFGDFVPGDTRRNSLSERSVLRGRRD